jgi:hypothetical protein
MITQEEQERINRWNNNGWLKDFLFYFENPKRGYTVQAFYGDCLADLESAKKAEHTPAWLPELQEAVNEISLVMEGL